MNPVKDLAESDRLMTVFRRESQCLPVSRRVSTASRPLAHRRLHSGSGCWLCAAGTPESCRSPSGGPQATRCMAQPRLQSVQVTPTARTAL